MGFFKAISSVVGRADKDITVETQLRRFLQNQLDVLEREGLRAHINEITVGYISHLVMLITKRPVAIKDVYGPMRSVFSDETSLAMIENAFAVFQGDVQTQEKLAALFPVAKTEFESGEGQFLVRHTRQAQREIEKMFTEGADFDPSKTPSWTAADLA